MIKVTRHAAKRFLERVIGTDVDDSRSLIYATRIIRESVRVVIDCDHDAPIIGFAGSYARIIDGHVLTVIKKDK